MFLMHDGKSTHRATRCEERLHLPQLKLGVKALKRRLRREAQISRHLVFMLNYTLN